MASFSALGGGTRRGGPPGTVWDPELGAFVTPQQQARQTQSRQAAKAAVGGNTYRKDPATGEVTTGYQPPVPGSGYLGTAPQYGSGRSGYLPASTTRGVAAGGSSGGDAANHRRESALSALESQVRQSMASQGQTTAPPPVVTSGGADGDPAAESAAYGQARERIGLALQSALRGLRESMGARGLGGSGIEGEALGDLFEGGLGELADVDRQLAEVGAGRAFQASQADTDRRIQQQQFNSSQLAQQEAARRASQDRSLDLLLQIARSY